MWKKTICMCLIISIVFSVLLMPTYALNTTEDAVQQITIHIPPNSSAVIPRGWVGSGSVIQYPVGTLTAGNWFYVTITSNSAGIPVIMQLYTPYGAGYSSRTITLGSVGWKSKVSASHYLLITNDNNYGTDISFYLTYY